MLLNKRMGMLAGAVVALLLAGFGGQPAAAQDSEESFSLSIVAALCDQLPTLGPFQGGGCVPAEGATFEVTTEGGDLLGSCVAEAAEVTGEDPATAFCRVEVPFGSTVVTTLDESTIPEGYALSSENPQTIVVPTTPPTGQFGGPVFIALSQTDDGTDDDGSDDVGTLPDTGAGTALGTADGGTPVAGLTYLAVLLVAIGGAVFGLRRRLVG